MIIYDGVISLTDGSYLPIAGQKNRELTHEFATEVRFPSCPSKAVGPRKQGSNLLRVIVILCHYNMYQGCRIQYCMLRQSKSISKNQKCLMTVRVSSPSRL